jgi:unsaturated chondroitin disaccharide hydrolase
MKRFTFPSLALAALLLFSSAAIAQKPKTAKALKAAEAQLRLLLAAVPVAAGTHADLVSPRSLDGDKLKLVSSRDWTSGFFPGMLWLLYENTGAAEWKEAARKHTAALEREKINGDTHDMGFKINNSFGNGFRLTKDPAYRNVMIRAAQTLSKRFNPVAGVIKSWDNRKEWAYPVIIDNMMNLELLFEATRLSGDSSFYRIAVTHARTTMRNHFRSDNSSWHVIDYDTLTGLVRQRSTHQGYADGSAWARGQAWGLYGFTMCYRETGDTAFLAQAERIAAFILHHPRLPADGVPYWDFDVPNPESEPRDASAAAVMASALYELSGVSKNRKEWRLAADRILSSLIHSYRSTHGANKGFLLIHSTGHKPAKSEIDVPIIYADYYYLEALMRSRRAR